MSISKFVYFEKFGLNNFKNNINIESFNQDKYS